jgi:hypothetical protein
MVGFSALALLCWLRSTQGASRGLFLPLMAVSLAAAVSSHYYAILVLLPLAGSELVRTWVRRKSDFSMWIALSAALIPLALFRNVIQGASGYATHFWAKPTWFAFAGFYTSFGHIVGIVLAAGAFGMVMQWKWSGETRELKAMPIWESIVFIGFALLPLPAVLMAKLITNAYTARYVLPATIGVVVLIVWAVSRARPAFAAMFVFVSVGYFEVSAYQAFSKNRLLRNELADGYAILNRTAPLSIAVPEVTFFHRLSFYAPRPFAARVAYISDPEMFYRYLGHDTIDRGMLDLRPWFPENIVPLNRYVKENPSFYAYGDVNEWTWQTFILPQISKDVQLQRRYQNQLLLLVQNASIQPGFASDVRPSVLPDLFKKYETSTRSICQIYFSHGDCPELQELAAAGKRVADSP